MSDRLHITDHALVRWLERVHGIDVEGWRSLMQREVAASIAAFKPGHQGEPPAFVLTSTGRVVSFITEAGSRPDRAERPAMLLPRLA